MACTKLLSGNDLVVISIVPPPVPPSNTPWEELYREKTGQLSTGGVLEFAVKYRGTSNKVPRNNH